jgi:uncharacterized protein DUF1844
MAAGNPDETFRVTDRRRRVDEDVADQVAAAVPPAPAPAATAPGAQHPEPREADAPASEPQPSGAEPSLVGLFMMLGTSAAVALGDSPDPVTGRVEPDLTEASDLIDVLVLLRAKTEGHRSPEETQVLDDLIYELQLRYVEARGRA